jgi:hypothetical protein
MRTLDRCQRRILSCKMGKWVVSRNSGSQEVDLRKSSLYSHGETPEMSTHRQLILSKCHNQFQHSTLRILTPCQHAISDDRAEGSELR